MNGWTISRIRDEFAMDARGKFDVLRWTVRQDGKPPRTEIPADLKTICATLNSRRITCCLPDVAIAEGACVKGYTPKEGEPWSVVCMYGSSSRPTESHPDATKTGYRAGVYELDSKDHPPELTPLITTLREFYRHKAAAEASRLTAEKERREHLATVAECLVLPSAESVEKMLPALRRLLGL